MSPHLYRITYRSWHCTRHEMQRHLTYALGTSRWSALRAWWQIERQWQCPAVEVVDVRLDHRRCPQIQSPRTWAYACAQA